MLKFIPKRQISFVIRHLIRKIIGPILSFFIKRDSNIIAFHSKCTEDKEVFLHNSKYLFLYLCDNFPNHKFYWLCETKELYNQLNNIAEGKAVYLKTLKGIYYALKSKFIFHDFVTGCLPLYLVHNATIINLWHGSGLMKKISYDDEKWLKNKFEFFIHNSLSIKDNYFFIDGEPEKKAFVTAFNIKPDNIKLLGFPRLDTFNKNFKNADRFMEYDANNIKELKSKGKNLLFYIPTWRDTNEDISGWLKSCRLRDFLKQSNSVLICKLHPFDTNSLNFELSEEFYKMNSDSDIYAVLKYADALISDYSSISFDFLLLDKPIIYYVPDLKEYEANCRGFYEPYENVTAGSIVKTEKDLLKALSDALNNYDNYMEKRKNLRDRMFIFQKGGSCKRIIDYIEELNN